MYNYLYIIIFLILVYSSLYYIFVDEISIYQVSVEHFDFDLLNDGAIRLSLGTVNVRTGNSHYFDSTQCRIGPEHIMASGALPPSFPPVIIDGEVHALRSRNTPRAARQVTVTPAIPEPPGSEHV
jgi:predicted acylesterase/phospholipase RssA